MDVEVADCLARAAKSLDAASAVVALNKGEYEEMSEMVSLWLLDEAATVRDVIDRFGGGES